MPRKKQEKKNAYSLDERVEAILKEQERLQNDVALELGRFLIEHDKNKEMGSTEELSTWYDSRLLEQKMIQLVRERYPEIKSFEDFAEWFTKAHKSIDFVIKEKEKIAQFKQNTSHNLDETAQNETITSFQLQDVPYKNEAN